MANWKKKKRRVHEESDEDMRADSDMAESLRSEESEVEEDDYDDAVLVELPEIKQITKILNLLAHENPFISE